MTDIFGKKIEELVRTTSLHDTDLFVVEKGDDTRAIAISDVKHFLTVSGPVGPAGPIGPQGIAGKRGATGPVPEIGADGNWILDGFNTGLPSRGIQGPTGATGPKGDKGDTGARGQDGKSIILLDDLDNANQLPPNPEIGNAYVINGDVYVYNGFEWANVGPLRGPQGEIGPQGPQGPRGYDGPEGPQGIAGPIGKKGVQGDEGPQGVPGIQGPTGAQGPKGEQGIQGPPGPTGPQGPEGPAGKDGHIFKLKGYRHSEAELPTNVYDVIDHDAITWGKYYDFMGREVIDGTKGTTGDMHVGSTMWFHLYNNKIPQRAAAITYYKADGTMMASTSGSSFKIPPELEFVRVALWEDESQGVYRDKWEIFASPDYPHPPELFDSYILTDINKLAYWTGAIWVNLDAVQGPQGDKGEKGDTGTIGEYETEILDTRIDMDDVTHDSMSERFEADYASLSDAIDEKADSSHIHTNYALGTYDVLNDISYLAGDTVCAQELQISGDIKPVIPVTTDIGSSVDRWRTLYVQDLDVTGDIVANNMYTKDEVDALLNEIRQLLADNNIN